MEHVDVSCIKNTNNRTKVYTILEHSENFRSLQKRLGFPVSIVHKHEYDNCSDRSSVEFKLKYMENL